MKRDNFLDSPAAWTRIARQSQTPAEYASPVERCTRDSWHAVNAVIAVSFVAFVAAWAVFG